MSRNTKARHDNGATCKNAMVPKRNAYTIHMFTHTHIGLSILAVGKEGNKDLYYYVYTIWVRSIWIVSPKEGFFSNGHGTFWNGLSSERARGRYNEVS